MLIFTLYEVAKPVGINKYHLYQGSGSKFETIITEKGNIKFGPARNDLAEPDVSWQYSGGVSLGAADQPMNVAYVEVKIPKDKSAEVEILADKVIVRFVEPNIVDRGAEGDLCAHDWERQHASVILCTYPEKWTDREVCRKCGKKVLVHCTGPYSVMEDGFWVQKSNGTETREEVNE